MTNPLRPEKEYEETKVSRVRPSDSDADVLREMPQGALAGRTGSDQRTESVMAGFDLKRLDPALWSQFLAKVYANNLTPKAVLLSLIQDYVNKK